MAKKLMIIDDEPRIVDILDNFFSRYGFDISKATNGLEALEMLKRDMRPDIVILDENMPVMGGISFLKELEILIKDLPVVILSGSLNARQIKEFKDMNYEHIFIKPVRLSELLSVVKKLVQE